MSARHGPSEGRYVLVAGMAMPDAGALLGEIAAGGRRVLHAGPADGPAGAIRDLFRSPGAQVPDGPLRRPGVPADLAAQAAAWLRELFPAAGISGEPDPRRLGNGPACALPCVAAALTAAPGAALLLEHPETGLHPRSQSVMGGLACRAAAAGAQVTVMTHSDHVINATRLAVKQGLLSPEAVTIRHYRPGPGGTVIADTPAVGADGMLSSWPDGFFDEWDHALDQLLDGLGPGRQPPAGPRRVPPAPRPGRGAAASPPRARR